MNSAHLALLLDAKVPDGERGSAQNCGGAAAIAGTRALRIASAVTIESNRAGSGGGGAVCVIADSQLAADASAGRVTSTVAVLGPTSDACKGGGAGTDSSTSTAVADAAIPFMVTLLTGALATVRSRPVIGTRSSIEPPHFSTPQTYAYSRSYGTIQLSGAAAGRCTTPARCQRRLCSNFLSAISAQQPVAEESGIGPSRIMQPGGTRRLHQPSA